ncbi:MAG TPA: 3-isopropylmalate dehydratase small subunit [Trebonia sp.]
MTTESVTPQSGTTDPGKTGGATVRFGDNIDTDVIIPGRYLVSIDPAELAEHAFEPLGEDVQRQVRSARVVVAGRNFGCGSAREQAASALIGAGVTAVVAVSFSRVFFRNAINTGLIAVECPDAVAALQDGDEAWINIDAGTVIIPAGEFSFPPYPEALRGILADGGLIPHLMRSYA